MSRNQLLDSGFSIRQGRIVSTVLSRDSSFLLLVQPDMITGIFSDTSVPCRFTTVTGIVVAGFKFGYKFVHGLWLKALKSFFSDRSLYQGDQVICHHLGRWGRLRLVETGVSELCLNTKYQLVHVDEIWHPPTPPRLGRYQCIHEWPSERGNCCVSMICNCHPKRTVSRCQCGLTDDVLDASHFCVNVFDKPARQNSRVANCWVDVDRMETTDESCS